MDENRFLDPDGTSQGCAVSLEDVDFPSAGSEVRVSDVIGPPKAHVGQSCVEDCVLSRLYF